MDESELYAYSSDVSELRRQLGEDPLQLDATESAGYSDHLERSAFSDDDSDIDDEEDSLSDQSDASFHASTSPPDNISKILPNDEDAPWSALEDSEQNQNYAATKRVLALTSPRGSHRTHEILSASSIPKPSEPGVEEPISSAERKAMKKARRKSLHATAHTLSKAVAHLKDSHKSRDRSPKDPPQTARLPEKPAKLKRGRSRSLTKDISLMPSAIASGSQSSDSGGSSSDLNQKNRSSSPASSSGSLEMTLSGSLKHSSANIRPPIVSAPLRTSSSLTTSASDGALPASSPSAPISSILSKSPPASPWAPPMSPLQYEQLGTKSSNGGGGSGGFLSILKNIRESDHDKHISNSMSSDIFSSMSSTGSTADDEELMLYVTPEKNLAHRRPLDLGLSSSAQPPPPAQLLREALLAQASHDPRLQKYREVLDLFNGPQLEALLKMMNDLIIPTAPVSHVTAYPPPPPEVDMYSGTESIAAVEIDAHSTKFPPQNVSPLQPAPVASHPVDFRVDDDSYRGWKDAMSSELNLRRELVSVKNWNEEFQKILRMPQEDLNTFSLLRSLGQDFVFTAETYGRIIISEMHLSPAEKTIKPVKIGGVAGSNPAVVTNPFIHANSLHIFF
jgi:hypothetical protein